MEPILGFDFGNFYSQLIWIQNMDPVTRRGGIALDLTDPTSPDPNGIPTAFFRSANRNNGNPCYGYQATRQRPASNIIRYLKRNMHDSVNLDGQTYTYAEMITQTIQHCVREANRQLHAQVQLTTNLIALAYPVTFDAPDRDFLKSLAEQATLEDGRHVQVVGTITEPAAAALDYLAEHPSAKPETCVMAYDLGAGTFDLSVVEAFPTGKDYPTGGTYYYDVRWTDGLPKLGGREFDKIVYDLITSKLGYTPTGSKADLLMNISETTKRELTTCDRVYPAIEIDGELPDIEITIDEFNRKAAPLLLETVNMVKRALADPKIPKPDIILLTGGASQMRIVTQLLEQTIPAYRGRIIPHRPSKAIAQGAARFATKERDSGITIGTAPHPQVVQQRTTLDLGILFTDPSDMHKYIETLISRGTPIPCSSKEISCYTLFDKQCYSDKSVYEAVNTSPVSTEPSRDYRNVMPNRYSFGRTVPKNTNTFCQLHIDKDNILYMTAWEPDNREQTQITWRCTYEQWRNT